MMFITKSWKHPNVIQVVNELDVVHLHNEKLFRYKKEQSNDA